MEAVAHEQHHADYEEEGWRLPFGNAGILDVAVKILASPDIEEELVRQSLRIVGNTCIDTGLVMSNFVVLLY